MAAGLLMVALTEAASLREFSPLSLVLPLQGSATFLASVPQFEAPSESLTHSIPRSFLVESLSASAVGLTDTLWLCPERALRLFFASVSFVDPVRNVAPLVQCLCLRYQSFASGSCGGASPHALGSVGTLGVSGGSTYIALHRTWSVSAILPYARWSSGRCFILFLRGVTQVFMTIILSVSLTYACPSLNISIGLCSLDT